MVPILVGVALAMFLSFLDTTIVATALPRIGHDLHAFTQIGWVATSYLLTTTVLQPLFGRFADIFGRKPVILFCLSVFLAGCALCGTAPNMALLIVFRGLTGVGAAGLMTLSVVIVSDIVPLSQRALFLSGQGVIFAFASVLGPMLGGLFTDKLSWRWVFFINLPIGGLAMLTLVLFLHIPRPTGKFWAQIRRLDGWGILTMMAATCTLLLAVSWGGNEYPWSHPLVIGLFIAGLVGTVLFVVVEIYVATEPLIPMRLFTNRNVALTMIGITFLGMVVLGHLIYMPIYFTVVRGNTATVAGLKLLPLMLGLVTSSLLSGVYINKTGRYIPLIWLGGVIATVGMGVTTLLTRHSTLGHEIGCLLVVGLGTGLCLQPSLLVAQSAASDDDVAIVTACWGFFQNIGSTIGLAIMGSVLNNCQDSELAHLAHKYNVTLPSDPSTIDFHQMPPGFYHDYQDAYAQGLRMVFIVAIPLMGLSLLSAVFLKHIPLRTSTGGANVVL
ncbi:major facilitator superfamily domain-containing protein [Dimargaris cristalligena]|uniref:Major facilitator superfamily domain-containing protein n=1 Tax=Dimargaris cristalligena TaxID=215637 RepID=A0A4P9ZSB0_9FUNG|nr:major facilitator superfamily domain-containing protein [Dimargaris cristalligena]|eukprot:RKP35681.1 major facilitator superfamily domain-containing protein [Dimargaris cristalligena]